MPIQVIKFVRIGRRRFLTNLYEKNLPLFLNDYFLLEGSDSNQQAIYHLNTANLNAQSSSSWFTEQYAVGIPLSVVNVTQLEKDTLLLCLESK